MKKKYRIKKNEEFQKIISRKYFFTNKNYIIYLKNKEFDYARIGISVSKKLGGAVERNLYKRQLRMIIHEIFNFNDFPYDVIIIVRKDFINNSFDNNKKLLENILKKVKINRTV